MANRQHTFNTDLCQMSQPLTPSHSAIQEYVRFKGLTYGSCYIMTFPDGKQLGRRQGGLIYEKGDSLQCANSPLCLLDFVSYLLISCATHRSTPFKVCKSVLECFRDGVIPDGGSFYLKDQFGSTRGSPGWVHVSTEHGYIDLTNIL